MTHKYVFDKSLINLDLIAKSDIAADWYKDGCDNLIGAWSFYIDDYPSKAWVEGYDVIIASEADKSCVYDYFDLHTDYEDIYKEIPKNQPFLKSAAEFCKGVRVLKPGLWNAIVIGMMYQSASRSKLHTILNQLRDDNDGWFPNIDKFKIIDLSKYKIGYAQKYLENYSKSNTFLFRYAEDGYTEAFNYFKKFRGIGDKTSSWICLYGLHYLEACYIDKTMRDIINKYYGGNLPVWMYSKYAGVYQLYCELYYKYGMIERNHDKCTV